MEGKWYDIILLSYQGLEVTLGNLLFLVLLTSLLFYVFYFSRKKLISGFLDSEDIHPIDAKRFHKIIRLIFFSFFLLILLYNLPINFVLAELRNVSITIAVLVEAFLILQVARLFDWLISNVFIPKYYSQRDKARADREVEETEETTKTKTGRTVQYIFYILALLFILSRFEMDASLWQTEYNGNTFDFRLSNILKALLVLLSARMIVWLVTQLILYGFYKRRAVDHGAQFAINQLLSYVIYTIAFIIALQNLSINMTLIWGGAAALLVGVGLGLQQTFNDFFSGIILLFERTVKVGDVLQINGEVGTVQNIGLRASTLLSRENIAVVVPNSRIVNENIVNWTHLDSKNRFEISIGVAYGSDIHLVKKMLLKAAKENPYVIEYPAPFVRFENFGDSALDFTLFIYSRNYLVIEDVKSDIRFDIDKRFRENNISIPFPQRDVWIRKEG